jgi:hypothetical protein
MDTNLTCAKCGSAKVVPRARVIDRGDYSADIGNVQVGVSRKPFALIFKGHEKIDMFARVCGECGFTELFVDEPEAIYDAYAESQRERDGAWGRKD